MIGTPLHSIVMFALPRRFLLTLFAALLLLCAGVSGVARAAVLPSTVTVAIADTVVPADVERWPSVPVQTPAGVEAGTAVELADAPMLPPDEPVLPLRACVHRMPCPVLDAGHPTPCLDGLLRPPCRRA